MAIFLPNHLHHGSIKLVTHKLIAIWCSKCECSILSNMFVLQVELLDAAKERNIIVCLRKSSSKIFIATKLIQELASAVRRLVTRSQRFI